MARIVPVNDIELDDLHEDDAAESTEQSDQDAFEAQPTSTTNVDNESPVLQASRLEEISENKPADGKAKISCSTSTAFGTWIGATLAIGALIVAVYYGYWSLRLQRWSALKDFKSQCQEAEKSNISTPECTAALALPLLPPPVMKRFAQRLHDCVTFRPGCSEASESAVSLASRSNSTDRKPWWLLLLQTFGLLISVSALVWLQFIPPDRLRATIHHHLGDRGMRLLQRTLRLATAITWETCILLSCFSPIYAVWFWWMFRKRMRFSSIVALTYIGGAFSVYYCYGSRAARRTQRENNERSWRVDAQSVEQQVWTRPDGVHVTRLRKETPSDNEEESAITLEFHSGLKRRHR